MDVLKFGGTSLGDESALRCAVEITRRHSPYGVVVSAASGVTDMLCEAVDIACVGGECGEYVMRFERRHKDFVREFGVGDVVEEALRRLERDLNYLTSGVRGYERVAARVRSLGERVMSRIFAAVLNRYGVEATPLEPHQAGLFATGGWDGARLTDPETLRKMLSRVKCLPVLPGYVGVRRGGDVVTLGRGGSDYTAAFVAAAVGADNLFLYTDTDGILTADPKTVSSARTVPFLSYEEAAELAFFGAKILHPDAVQPTVKAGIPITVANTLNPEGPKTVISERPSGTPVAGVAFRLGVSVMNLVSSKMLDAYGFLGEVFNVLRRHKVVVDVVSTSEVSVSLTAEDEGGLKRAAEELRSLADVRVEDGRAVVCVVGEGLRRSEGIAAGVFAAVAEKRINIEMISQGASEINLTFVVKEEDAPEAVRAVHQRFFED